MKVLIVDDELSARRRLVKLLSKYSEVEIIGEVEDGLEALEAVASQTPDVLFLDIQMPELDGFGIVRALPSYATNSPLIVFATSYDQHALAAFEANAIAYLLKPVEEDRLDTVVARLQRLLLSGEESSKEKERVLTVASVEKRLNRLVCRKGNRVVLLDPAEVLWFFSDEGIVRAKTATDTYWVNYQLNQLEEGLDPKRFFRARREALVNLDRVRAIKPYDRSTFMLVMEDNAATELQVSERQAKELRQVLPGL